MTKLIGGQSFAEQLRTSAHGSMAPEALYAQLGELIRTMPDLDAAGAISDDTHKWLGRAYVLVDATKVIGDAIALKFASEQLLSPTFGNGEAAKIRGIVYRAFAVAESRAPASAQGAFIAAGNVFDAMARIGKVLGTASRDVLMIDPYMDVKALTDFAVQIPEGVTVRLLADQHDAKESLRPGVERWRSQHGGTRPLVAKLSRPRTLHDRAILVDGTGAWVLTQSFNAFAARAHGLISRVDSETAALKISAYEDLWDSANDLIQALA
jgi:hypothetical protein